MLQRILLFCFFLFSMPFIFSQTTDLSVSVAAQNLEGSDVSQVHIFEDFQYVVTISNSGGAVSNATFSIDLSDAVTVESYLSQNNVGGASLATDFNLEGSNVLTGTVPSLPNNSSVEIKLMVTAPSYLGGIAIAAEIISPGGTTDINEGNNQSIISMNVVDVPIDFTVTNTQINPSPGTGISTWGETVTYQFTITNNSIIDYPLSSFSGIMTLNTPLIYGSPIIAFESIECIGATNGMACIDLSGVSGSTAQVNSVETIFTMGTSNVFTAGGSLTFEVQYQITGASCAFEIQPIEVGSSMQLLLNHENESSNFSNTIPLTLLESELCNVTDICIDTVQINPDISESLDWGEEITFTTTVCNDGPLDAYVAFFLQNLTPFVEWEIVSLECTDTTGNLSCSDVTLTQNDIFWTSENFLMPANTTITITSTLIFIEPECSVDGEDIQVHLRSGTNILQSDLFDSNNENSAQSDYLSFPAAPLCPSEDIYITKTQIDPALPIGSDENNTADWGEITYEITAFNNSEVDVPIALEDYIIGAGGNDLTGTLVSVACVSTTGTASCLPLDHVYVGEVFDGIPNNNENDVLWEILAEDNWILPGESSVTFQVVVDWYPGCSEIPMYVENHATIEFFNDQVIDSNEDNNEASVRTYLAPCVDLVVQTFPEYPQVNVNQQFDWIIDISNSSSSYNAINIDFENILGDEFTINGTPTCNVTNGNAACISNLQINGNTLTGLISFMEPNATIRIVIPVLAPNFGGAFTNTVSAIPNQDDNEELSPETNTSISNVQVIAPFLVKSFDTDMIYEGQQTTLTFTINNTSTSPQQTGIAFVDNLPSGMVLNGSPYWIMANGATGDFVGDVGDTFVGITNLSIPQGISNCTFSVAITANEAGSLVNSYTNFSDLVNIDATQTFAELTVLEDTTDVDIAVIKSVEPSESSLGESVVFTIQVTNNGSSTGNNIEITEMLPASFVVDNYEVSTGIFDITTYIWSLSSLAPQQTETLTLETTIVLSSELTNVVSLTGLLETDRDETNNADEASVTLDNCLEIPQAFTPNNDGFNDYFVIPCLQDYGSNNIRIFNRYGTTVFKTENYDNNWNGKPNQGILHDSKTLLPVGTYYYVLEIDALDKPVVGWVYLTY
ncbi:gliding motility-associated C-terminal domain-containing protein [Mangrovimonas futianensis]|uniref:DUF7933 domain-containing protein n=2 Tax=Mangrovimonas futianensis TaxID=2895523 RepID=UPI001E3109A7|nr:gliding motility-associated C-terminal domain-containing protein [Mangrovimonas futianensis]MCF1193795.1 gliding motility-associated C-terminal domain-containing protein [Mangrovimonas futianensis]